jgi:hypothetical protein
VTIQKRTGQVLVSAAPARFTFGSPHVSLPRTYPLVRFSHVHLSFKVDNPKSTSIIVMIQKRTTTWFSFQPLSS